MGDDVIDSDGWLKWSILIGEMRWMIKWLILMGDKVVGEQTTDSDVW